GRFEIVRPGMYLAADRQAGGPIGQLEQNVEEFCVGERADRRLDRGFVVAVEDDVEAAGLEAFNRGGKQVTSGALHHVLNERSEPSAIRSPLPLGLSMNWTSGAASSNRLGMNRASGYVMARPDGRVRVRLPFANVAMIGGCGGGAIRIG